MYILTCFSTFSANLASRQYFLIFIHYLLSSRINLIQYLPTWHRIFAPIHESCFAFSAPTTENQTLLFIAAPAGRRILSWINFVFLWFWQVYFSYSVSIFLKFPKVYFSDSQSVFLEPLLFSTAPLPGGRPILSGIGLDPTLRLSWTRRQSAAACRCNPSDQISNSILGQHQVPGRPGTHRHRWPGIRRSESWRSSNPPGIKSQRTGIRAPPSTTDRCPKERVESGVPSEDGSSETQNIWEAPGANCSDDHWSGTSQVQGVFSLVPP